MSARSSQGVGSQQGLASRVPARIERHPATHGVQRDLRRPHGRYETVLGQQGYRNKGCTIIDLSVCRSVYKTKTLHGPVYWESIDNIVEEKEEEWRYYHTGGNLYSGSAGVDFERNAELGICIKTSGMRDNERPTFMRRLWEELRTSPRLTREGVYVALPGSRLTLVQIWMDFGTIRHGYVERVGPIELHGVPIREG